MKVIGITGRAGSGKDFVAQLIKRLYPDVQVFSFAEKLKRAAMVLFNLTEDDVFTREGKKRITEWRWEEFHENISRGQTGFMTVRDILQITGTELIRDSLNRNHWIMLAEKVVLRENANFSVFTDTRFENEIELVRKYDGIIINVFGRVDSDVPLHSSELLKADYDYRIINDYRTSEEQVTEQIKAIILEEWNYRHG